MPKNSTVQVRKVRPLKHIIEQAKKLIVIPCRIYIISLRQNSSKGNWEILQKKLEVQTKIDQRSERKDVYLEGEFSKTNKR